AHDQTHFPAGSPRLTSMTSCAPTSRAGRNPPRMRSIASCRAFTPLQRGTQRMLDHIQKLFSRKAGAMEQARAAQEKAAATYRELVRRGAKRGTLTAKEVESLEAAADLLGYSAERV